MQLKYKEALKQPKKNIFNVDGGEWKNKTGSGVMNTRNLEQYATDNPVRIAAMYPNPLISDVKTYYLSWDTSKFNIAVWEIDAKGMIVADFGWKSTATSYTMKSNTVAFTVVVSNKANSNISISEAKNLKLQVEPGTTATSYEDYQIRNSVANKNSKNLLKKLKSYQTTSGSTLNSASHTNYVSDEDNDVIVKTTTAWAGYYNYLDYLDLNYYRGRRMTLSFTVGEQTMGGESAGQISILVRPPNGVEAYATSLYIKPSRIGFREVLSFVVPIDTTYMRIAIRNTGNVADAIHVKNLQLEEGQTATEFGTYQITSEKAQLVPKKNYLLPFTKWVADNPVNVSVNFLEQTERRLVVELNNTNVYTGVSMPIDMNVLNRLKGKTVTFSAKKIVRSQSNSQVQLRFYGGASGNTDFVLSGVGAMSITKTIPTDFTNAFMRVQNNQAGYLQIEVEDLQLEINSTQTPYEVYELAPKQTPYPTKAPYRNYPFSFQRESVEVLDGISYGKNNPRIRKGGVLVEEGTKNLFNPLTINGDVEKIVENGELVYKLDSITNTDYEDFQTGLSYIVSDSKTYTISFLAKWHKFLIFEPRSYDANSTKLSDAIFKWVKQPPANAEEYQEYEILVTLPTGATKSEFFRWWYGPSENEAVAYLKRIQLEEKAYSTSYTQKERQDEKLIIPNPNLDLIKGSVEFTFKTGSNFANRWSWANLPIIDSPDATNGLRLFTAANGTGFLSTFAYNTLYVPFNWLTDTVYNIRLEWESGTLYAYADDVLVQTKVVGANAVSTDIHLGMTNVFDRLNGLTFYNFIIKDRDGKITYEM